jgi:hypothetical protein
MNLAIFEFCCYVNHFVKLNLDNETEKKSLKIKSFGLKGVLADFEKHSFLFLSYG